MLHIDSIELRIGFSYFSNVEPTSPVGWTVTARRPWDGAEVICEHREENSGSHSSYWTPGRKLRDFFLDWKRHVR